MQHSPAARSDIGLQVHGFDLTECFGFMEKIWKAAVEMFGLRDLCSLIKLIACHTSVRKHRQ